MGEVAKQLFASPPPHHDHGPPLAALGASSFPAAALDFGLGGSGAGGAATAAAAAPLFGAASPGSGHKRAATFRVPSDDEGDDDDPAAGWGGGSLLTGGQPGGGRWSGGAPSAAVHARHPVQAVLAARTKQLQAGALLMAEAQQQRLHRQIAAVEEQLAGQLAEVQQQLAHKRARAAAADEESRKQRSAERSRRLAEAQRAQAVLEQAQASALQEVQRQQEEERRRREAEAARLRQQQEEERRRKEAEAAAAAAKAAAEAAKARDEAAAAAAAAAAHQQQQRAAAAQQASAPPSGSPARPPPGGGDPHVKATPGALAEAERLAAKLAAAEAAAAEITSRPELKAARRALEKQITMAVSQISGTQQQVQAKAAQLIGVLRGVSSPQQAALAQLTLAARVVSQCEGQVAKIGSFAFPLAYVCVGVGAALPEFMDLLLAKLQQACPLLVPRYAMYTPGSPVEDWYAALGYRDIDDPKTGERRRETQDELVSRLSAMVLLFGAIVQTEAPGNPAGLAHGWAWLARCLNALPPTRPSAAALMSFLSHAGFRMAAVYGRQFGKAMAQLAGHWLPALEAKAAKDADLRAVGTRLAVYVSARGHAKEPEGRTLKKVDESSYTRA
ncbi:GLE1 [Scenedesmus sp. PABB004]|nr:GLE1 [Scenedesmus sp. PABB004]